MENTKIVICCKHVVKMKCRTRDQKGFWTSYCQVTFGWRVIVRIGRRENLSISDKNDRPQPQ